MNATPFPKPRLIIVFAPFFAFLLACSSSSPAVTIAAPYTLYPTHTPRSTYTPMLSATVEAKSTQPPEPTPTATQTATHTPMQIPTVTAQGTATASTAPTFTPPLGCSVLPSGGFLAVWQLDQDVQLALGCPISNHPRITPTAWEVTTAFQPFERGMMIWSDHIGWYAQPVVYVVYADSTYQRYDDTYDAVTDPVSGGETPPNGMLEPILGFGKVWREVPGVREAVGWATENETPGEGRFQLFDGGEVVWISQTDKTYVFADIARVFDVSFFED